MLSGLWLLATGSAEAQQLSGLLVEDPPRRPLPDAVVQLLADRDSVAASVTGSAAGRFVLRGLMAGRYRVRVLRIGHSPWVSGFLTLAVGEARDTTLAIPLQPVTLQDIVVTARTSCRASPAEDGRMMLVWDQARTALVLAEAASSELLEFRGSTARRLINAAGYLSDEQRWSLFTRGEWPVRSQSPDSLARFGFVQPRDTATGPVYFGPDVPVFFSNAFIESHCFRLVPAPKGRGELVGLAFEPAKGGDLPDIEGVLWLDRATATLHRLIFRYTGLWSWVPERSTGGEIQFGQLADGRPVVTGWLLRAPIAKREMGPASRDRRPEDGSERFFGKARVGLFGYEEEQARVDQVRRRGADTLWSRAEGDSSAARPAPFTRDLW